MLISSSFCVQAQKTLTVSRLAECGIRPGPAPVTAITKGCVQAVARMVGVLGFRAQPPHSSIQQDGLSNGRSFTGPSVSIAAADLWERVLHDRFALLRTASTNGSKGA